MKTVQIKWSEETPREKMEHIICNVLGWPYFPVWDLAITAQYVLEHNGITYPYAYWNDQQGCAFVYREALEKSEPFQPLIDTHDALQLVIKGKFYSWYFHYVKAGTYPDLTEDYYSSSLYWIAEEKQQHTEAEGGTLPEAICIAVLRACGLEVAL